MTGRPVICLYVFDQARAALTKRNARPLGSAARWWLAQSLRALHKSLNAIGSSLLLRQGCAAEVVAGLARETGADTVFWNEIAHARTGRLPIRSPPR
jgi:deoxyribodipyrimidine photo-lyase